MKNNTRSMLCIIMILCGVFFIIGSFITLKAGISPKKLINRIDENIRRLDISPGFSEYIDISKKENIDLKGVEKIVIRSTFTTLDVSRGSFDYIEANLKGSVKSEISKDALSYTKDGSILLIDMVNKKAVNPTTSGLRGNITIPLSYKGNVEIYTESGNITYNSIESNDIYIKTISGDVTFEGGRDNNLTLKSESGNLYIYAIGVMGNVITTSGTVDIKTSYLEGDYKTKTGYIHIQANEMTSGVNLFTTSGEIEYTVSAGYKYEVHSDSGEIRFMDEVRFSPLKGIHNNGFNDLKITSVSGNVYLE